MEKKKLKKTKQAADPEVTENREARAVARYVRTAPRKLRLVVDAIRGRQVEEALKILRFTPKRAAKVLEKVLKSAVANAENNLRLSADNLYVHKAFIDGGPVIKRWIPRAMGRASKVHKRTSHITFIVREGEAVK
ncbi:MAG: 50S ribosomal protein L22 [Candidatus Eremiobacteraeota bacterium]|nr:50S ribosomal protein L22 [Candidatus Eremiobacteraeota bacterium]